MHQHKGKQKLCQLGLQTHCSFWEVFKNNFARILRDLVFSLLNLDLVFVFNFPVSIDFV